MLLIGIDEAGYGPKIGPLCHGYCAIRVPEPTGGVAPDLWQLLHPTVMRHPAFPGAVTVDDSKKIYAQGSGLALLRHGVSAFLECLPALEGMTLADLYATLLPECDRQRLHEDAWGRFEPPVLVEPVLKDGPIKAARGRKPKPHPLGPAPEFIPCLREALGSRGMEVVALGARAMSARDFNALLRTQNKADVNWSVISQKLQELLALARPDESIYAVIDRQGGRKFYTGKISHLFGEAMTWVESETQRQSVYRIEQNGRIVRVCFFVEADGETLPVALASMCAKLVRELCMERLNGYFRQHLPELRPTAGYYGDANRFLRETKRLRKQLEIGNPVFVRRK